MTRDDAVNTIYQIIYSGIISDELGDELMELCSCICNDDFDMCECPPEGQTNYCE